MPKKALVLKAFNIRVRKMTSSQKLYYRGSPFSNFVYYQQLSIACYLVSFYANNYFEYLPKVSSAFFVCGK